jgi:hypothetical protein
VLFPIPVTPITATTENCGVPRWRDIPKGSWLRRAKNSIIDAVITDAKDKQIIGFVGEAH